MTVGRDREVSALWSLRARTLEQLLEGPQLMQSASAIMVGWVTAPRSLHSLSFPVG